MAPIWGPVLAVAEVEEAPPKILEATLVDALVQPIRPVELEDNLVASPD